MRVEVEQLSRRFGAVLALDDVEFELAPGTRVALAGPNGSGKSTLIRILAGLLRYEGRVRLDGRDRRDRSAELARRISYLPQTSPQAGAPVRELVRAVGSLRGFSESEIAARAADFELDLSAIAARPLRALSGGMRQKLLLALALVRPVSLLILDEPTASLDPRARERFVEAIDGLARDTTVVLCSHRVEEVAALVDRVLALESGRLVQDAPISPQIAAPRAPGVVAQRVVVEAIRLERRNEARHG